MLSKDSKIFTAAKTPPTWDLEYFRMITHFEAVFLWEIMLPTDSKIFTATETPPTWDLEFFRMITHFEAVFFVGNNASNRKQDIPSHQNFLLPGT